MNCNDVTTRLDDWLDGELPAGEAGQLEAHLAGCSACREESDALRRIIRGAASLRREVQPGRDLWPGIHVRMEKRSSGNWLRGLAATLVLGGVFLAGMLADRVLETTDSDREVATIDRIPAGSQSAAARRVLPRAQVELVAGVRSAGGSETEKVLLHNLLIINLAIRQVEQALQAEPDKPELRDLLASLHQQENDLLRRAERMRGQASTSKRIGI